MYLKSLELQGFKSFPDKVKLDFDKGLTAVVGPNGSGKSNIADAVRWVLGEQSTKNLRGGKMEDVIFAGTQARKEVGFAQVTLNIDNTSRELMYDNDIVSITRKLYRSGESDYIINGKNVRLKDVVEMFMDTGLGRDGYSIIGQGRVADIVSSKSAERREIFEEAAGISKFRYKKEEAQRRLCAAQDNILRLRDIIAELEMRVEPLKIQSEKAKQFLEYSENKKKLELTIWMNKLSSIKENINSFEENYLIKTSEYESKENEIEEIEEAIESAYKNMQQSSMLIEKLRGDLTEIEKQKSQENAEIAVLENDIIHLNNLIMSLDEKIEKSKLTAGENKLLLEESNQLFESLNEQELANNEMIAQIENEFATLSIESGEADKEFNEKNDELNKLYIKKSELSFKVQSSQANIVEIEEQISALTKEKTDIQESCDKIVTEKNALFASCQEIDEALTENNNKLSGYIKLLEKKNEQLAEHKKEHTSLEFKIREMAQKKHFLTDLDNNMEGFSNSVKEVIKAGQIGRINGIHGTVGQLIKAENKFSIAIETALGAAMQNVIVENEDTAKRCIRLLKENNSGRATFLPITSVKGNVLNEKNLEKQDGFISVAADIVSVDKKYSGIINSLLGRIVIAENLSLATLISKKYGYRFRVVTLDGQVINAGGSFTGGSISKTTGVLTRKNEIENIKRDMFNFAQNYKDLEEKVIQYQAEADKLNIDVEGLRQTVATVNSDKIRFDSEYKYLCANSEQMSQKLEGINNSLSSLSEKISNQKSVFETSTTQLQECESRIAEIEEHITQQQAVISEFHNKRASMSEQLSALKFRQIELKKDIQACQNSIEQLNKSIAENDTGSDIIIRQIDETKLTIEQKQDIITSKKSMIVKFEKETASITESIKQQQENHQQFESKATENRNLQRIKGDEKELLSKEIAKLGERKVSIQREYDTIIAEMWEQYQLSRSEAAAFVIEVDDINSAQRQLNDFKGKIKNLGNVNVSAIEEYEEVSERYEFLSKQMKDVESSKAELEALIKDLTYNMKKMFSESFEEINNNFKSIFVELFGGGTAELVLTDPENILESGIEIIVAPPGKVIKSLSLLSGGEQAFIAIAIYFSILKLRPSPFCILDEIEAALDDVNVAKYAAYLRNFTDTTQFILVTHRRGTMEEADVLYGVTMQQKGISKLLKMDNRQTVNVV